VEGVDSKVSEYFKAIATKRHKENPTPRETYVEMGKKSGEAKRAKKDKLR